MDDFVQKYATLVFTIRRRWL